MESNSRVSSGGTAVFLDSLLGEAGYGLVFAVLCSGGFSRFAVVVEVVAEYLFEEY